MGPGGFTPFSFRPPEGYRSRSFWLARGRPPYVVFLRSDDSPEVEIRPPVAQPTQTNQPVEELTTRTDPNRADQIAGDSQNHTPVEIADQVSGVHLFTRRHVGDIPFARPLMEDNWA